MHQSYQTKLGYLPDFRVEYRFYTHEEGGRQMIPFQGYRSDFWYDHPEHGTSEIFMIWPEFEDERGELILEDHKSVLPSGTARMWIIIPERRSYHKGKIYIGLTGYFMEGTRRVAECNVIEVLNLPNNRPAS